MSRRKSTELEYQVLSVIRGLFLLLRAFEVFFVEKCENSCESERYWKADTFLVSVCRYRPDCLFYTQQSVLLLFASILSEYSLHLNAVVGRL